MTRIDSTGAAAVDPGNTWRPMDTCPLGVKVQLLGMGGVASYGSWNGKETFWTGWCPLPAKPKGIK